MKLKLTPFSKQTIIAILICTLLTLFFVYRWQNIKSSPSYERAVDFILSTKKNTDINEIHLQSYKMNSTSSGKTVQFEFKLEKNSFIAIKVVESGGVFTVTQVPSSKSIESVSIDSEKK